jgi:hypothetical protein
MADLTSRRMSEKLYAAAREGRVDDISRLSTHFGDVGTLGAALYRACEGSQLNVVTWLVEHTVLRDDGERLGRALVKACEHGHWNIMKWLVINTQVNVSKVHFEGDNSILHQVISFNADKSRLIYKWLDEKALCRLVYVCGEDVNVQDKYNGNTPLHTVKYCADTVGALLLAGADETIANEYEETPVQFAVKYGIVKVLPLLDVSSKWKLLVRSHRLRRRAAVRVMMTLVKWKVQTRSMWTRSIMTLHAIVTLVKWKVKQRRKQTRSMWTRAIRIPHTILKLTSVSSYPTRDESNDENRNCCWLNIRDCRFAVACCYKTCNYSTLE